MSAIIGANSVTYPVANATAIRRYRFVEVGSTGAVTEANNQTDVPVGVSNGVKVANDGQTAISVMTFNGGVIKVEAAGAVAAGALVESDAQGRAATAGGNTARAIGPAKTAATAAGDIIEVSATLVGFASN